MMTFDSFPPAVDREQRTERAASARRRERWENVEGLPCGADTKDQGAAFAAPENREQRTENAGKKWKVLRKHKGHQGPRRLTKTARMGRAGAKHQTFHGYRRCFFASLERPSVVFASLERPSVVHRLKPIRGRLPPADCQDGLHCASTHKDAKVRKGYKAFHDSPFGCSVARQGALWPWKVCPFGPARSVFRSPFS